MSNNKTIAEPFDNVGRPEWRVHSAGLLRRADEISTTASPIRIPLAIFGRLLHEVGEHAARINDPELNKLMVQLTIYDVADPASPGYDPEVVERVFLAAEEARRAREEL